MVKVKEIRINHHENVVVDSYLAPSRVLQLSANVNKKDVQGELMEYTTVWMMDRHVVEVVSPSMDELATRLEELKNT